MSVVIGEGLQMLKSGEEGRRRMGVIPGNAAKMLKKESIFAGFGRSCPAWGGEEGRKRGRRFHFLA